MSAASGDVEAINRILKHYEGYIAVLSTRKLYDEYGNLHYCVDETLRRRLETKLITKILKFKIHFAAYFTRQNHRCAAWAVFFFMGVVP